MQFELITDLDRSLPAVIEFNFEQLKGELSQDLERYRSLVVTEDTVQDGKKRRADLNKWVDALDTQRKAVKKACLSPYEDFEAKCKELTGMVKKAIQSIDTQVKSFDDAKKAEKREAIEKLYVDNIGNLAELLPFYSLWSDKWLNVSEKLPVIEKAMVDAIAKFRNDLGVIKAMRLDSEQQVLDVYIRTLDMSAALAEKTRLEVQAKQLKKLAEADLERRQNEQLSSLTAPIIETHLSKAVPVTTLSVSVGPVEAEQTKDIDVRFYNTTAAFRADMKALTEKHNITYGSVK